MTLAQLRRGDIDADIDAVAEPHALLLEQCDAAVDVVLLELEVGHAEAQQPARPLVALVYDDLVAGAVEMRRRRQPGRARPDDADAAAAARGGRVGDDPAFLPRALDDR